MRPDLVFLLAPSVKFCMPHEAENAIKEGRWPSPSTEREVRRFFFLDLTTEAADQHQLGNTIGPMIVASHLGFEFDCPDPRLVRPEALPGIFHQQITRAARSLSRLDNQIEDWLSEIKQHLTLCDPSGVVIFDDDTTQIMHRLKPKLASEPVS